MSDKIIKTFPEDAKYPEDILFTIQIIPEKYGIDFVVYKGAIESNVEYINGYVDCDGRSRWFFEYNPFHPRSNEDAVNITLVLVRCLGYVEEYCGPEFG